MQTISEIRRLLDERGLRPKRSLGQNFLHDQNQLRKLIDAADLDRGDVVLEVGPGTGTLTEALLESEAEVIACELDDNLADLVADRFAGRIALIRGDCLDKRRTLNAAIVDTIAARRFRLVANLPYNVASPLLATLLINHPNCAGQFVTIQKEVADRLLAKPGSKDYGPLGIIIQALAEVRRIGTVPPSCFWPQPKVTSAMVSLLPSPPGRGAGDEGDPHGTPEPKKKPTLNPSLLTFASQQRKKFTDAEQLMWALLRDRRLLDLKFRRQHPVGDYILDFYCHSLRLAVEIDGGQHNEPEQSRRDAKRTAFLESRGIKIIRFWNHEVLAETESVLEALWWVVNERESIVGSASSLDRPHPQPLSQRERGARGPLPAAEDLAEGKPAIRPGVEAESFARFITDLFSKRRKQLGTIFGRDHTWPEDIAADQRPETLTIDQLVRLWRRLSPGSGQK